jgi:hypothetical protein
MADEKQAPPTRGPTLPHVDDPIGDRTPTNDDLFPVGNGRRIDLVALAKILAKVIPIVAAAIIPAYTAFHVARQRAVESSAAQAQDAKQKAEDGFQAVRHDVEDLKAWRYAQQKREAELARGDQVKERKKARANGRPAPVQPALPPVPPPPKPLPKDLDTAARLATQAASVPAPPRAIDAGP